jgi:hypothetical protein
MKHEPLNLFKNLRAHHPSAKMWAVAILRDDFKYTFKEIGIRMELSQSTCQYLYEQFNLRKK